MSSYYCKKINKWQVDLHSFKKDFRRNYEFIYLNL